ncbi:MAG: family 78 glycoside hydrolase catalytic domain [Verrucomicrobia bacterium]|nr:family 78 glycoside hydrolase catalytic domain [Verrucomicrobiota bacterium]
MKRILRAPRSWRQASCLALLCAASMVQGSIVVDGLRCEYRTNPLGIDAARPRLSWVLHSDVRGEEQTAYQILAASSPDRLSPGAADLWNSGYVASGGSLHARYAGKRLEPGQRVYWKVRVWGLDDRKARVWGQRGQPSPWSQPAWWEMGLLSPDDWQAEWIGAGVETPQRDEDFYRERPAPLFRKEFTLPQRVARARLYIAGLGYYEARLNGQRVSDRRLDPGWTRYSTRVLYSVYDVTRQLRKGRNCLGVMLGNGWYNPLPLRMWGHLNLREHMPVGEPCFLARLEVTLADGARKHFVSDTSWQTAPGPIRFNNIYLGEIYDARRELPGWDEPGFDAKQWAPAVRVQGPSGRLQAQAQPPIRVTKTLTPVAVTEPKPGVFIVDFGQNFAGWVTLKCKAPAGAKVTLRYGELLHKDGTLNPMTSVAGQIKGRRKTKDGRMESVGGPGAPPIAWQSDTYIAKGVGIERYTPRFTFHGFRYVEITGLPYRPTRDTLTGLRLNADVERAGEFACSNEQFNRIQEMCDWTFLSNLFSVQSDCPHRERFAYGGDIAATSEALMMNYDMAAFYAKAARDWRDSALPDGLFTDTAPFVGIQYCGVAWAMVHPLLLRQLYQYYGNRALIEEQYAAARRWLDRVTEQFPDRIVTKGLSDHEGLTPTPAPLLVTPLYAASARWVSELAAILGRGDEAARYRQLAAAIQKAYLEKFLDRATGKVGPGTQASQSFALYLDLLPPEQRTAALEVLINDIRGPRKEHLSTGIFGTKFMLDVLSRAGQADLAATIVGQKTFPGWGYMLANGATTLWEHWKGSENTYSHNHPMFGSVSQWFYQWLGGIQPAPDAVGFDRILIRPQMVQAVDWVRCRYRSARGDIVSNWRREGDRLTMEVEIPVNAGALVYVPLRGAKPTQVEESGRPAAQSAGVQFVGVEQKHAVYQVGSGKYRFEVRR